MKQISRTKPQEVVVSKSGRNWLLTVNYDIKETSPDGEGTMADGETPLDSGGTAVSEYESASVLCEKKPTESYASLVAAIVRTRYSADDVEAIVQNYVGSKTTEHKTEWTELQTWRATAKEMAKRVLGDNEESN